MKTSIIIPNRDEPGLLPTLYSLISNTTPTPEIIVVDDGSQDGGADAVEDLFPDVRVVRLNGGPSGAIRARNAGAAQASGDLLVFSDAHCRVPKGWLEGLQRHINGTAQMVAPGVQGWNGTGAVGTGMSFKPRSLNLQWNVGMTRPGEAFTSGLGFMVIQRQMFKDLGGFDEGQAGVFDFDIELILRAWLGGYRLIVDPTVVVAHAFKKAFDWQVGAGDVLYNRLRVALLYFGDERIERVLGYYKDDPALPAVTLRLMQSGIMQERAEFQARRVHDDDWLFAKFGVEL